LLPGSWTLVAVQQALIKQAVEAGHSGQQGIFLPGSWTLEAVQQQVLLLLDSWIAGHKRLYSRQFLYQAAGH